MRRSRRNPFVWTALIIVVIALGLGSRRFGHSLPVFVATYAGDTLWALVVFLGIGLLVPKTSKWRVAALAVSFSVMIEMSQLYHAPWIDSIRGTTLGALILGQGFLWGDLACYFAGIGLGVILDERLT
jgi:glycopeptide antibiotics resistance protein